MPIFGEMSWDFVSSVTPWYDHTGILMGVERNTGRPDSQAFISVWLHTWCDTIASADGCVKDWAVDSGVNLLKE